MGYIGKIFVLLLLLFNEKVMAKEISIKVEDDLLNDTILNLFEVIVLLAIGAFVGYHIGLVLRIYIRLAFWGVVLYIISLIILQSLGVVKIETETIIKTVFIIVPFIKGLIKANIFPKVVWWGIFIGIFVGFFYSDLRQIYKVTKKEKEKEKEKSKK